MKQGKQPKRVAVVRADRLGDVLLSLPALLSLRQGFLKSCVVDFYCHSQYLSVLAPLLFQNGIQGIPFLVSDENIFKNEYDGVCFLYARPGLFWQSRKRKIPIRTGSYSKWQSFVLLNAGLRQNRSRAEKNEGAYSLDLAKRFLSEFNLPTLERTSPVLLPVHPDGKIVAEKTLVSLGVLPGTDFIVLHPGMGGSALNLSSGQYAELIRAIESTCQIPVLISRGPSPQDQQLVSALQAMGVNSAVVENIPLTALMEVFRFAKWVIAPSTGPLHLAHAVGCAVVGLFPPVKSHRVERWGPWGGKIPAKNFWPDVQCPGRRRCVGKSCPYFFCMDRTPWTKLVTDWMKT